MSIDTLATAAAAEALATALHAPSGGPCGETLVLIVTNLKMLEAALPKDDRDLGSLQETHAVVKIRWAVDELRKHFGIDQQYFGFNRPPRQRALIQPPATVGSDKIGAIDPAVISTLEWGAAELRRRAAPEQVAETKAAETAGSHGTTPPRKKYPVLKPADVPILEALRNAYPSTLTQEAIEAAIPASTRPGLRTIQRRLSYLRKVKLVCRPLGDKGGNVISDVGRDALQVHRGPAGT